MSERITIKQGDYILLSDIPNEEAFNLVKNCFKNAGFPDTKSGSSSNYAQYNERTCWDVILLTESKRQCFGDVPTLDDYDYSTRRLTLSDVLNSTNGGYDWNGVKVVHLIGGTCTLPKLIKVERIQETVKETSWYEAGELPPTDTVCEYRFPNPDVGWTEVRVNYISDKHAVVTCLSDGLECHTDGFKSYDFRPINEERKRVIGNALSRLTMFRSAKQVLGELYDAGMLKGI